MLIRTACEQDIPRINDLLYQVLMVHHNGRPDIFRPNVKKYTDEELLWIMKDPMRPIFVAIDEEGILQGYAFCIFEDHKGSHVLTPIKSLYIDDLCVDETKRGLHIGKQLYDHVVAFARETGCYNVTLNVWSCNTNAMKFYENIGLVPQKVGMEQIL